MAVAGPYSVAFGRGATQLFGCWVLVVLWAMFTASTASAQLDFESEPINYNTAPTSDRVEQLKSLLETSDISLDYDDKYGYLQAILEALDVPVSSQMLVFSKTSFQLRKISPSSPRAIYFNDDVYVGWVPGADVLELSVADPQQGAVFYTVSQQKTEAPKIVRDRGQCIACHASSRTMGVPGHLVRSVYASQTGLPFFGAGTFTTDHSSPFEERWGGWYVTGTHGGQRHMGNVIATDEEHPETLDMEKGANVTSLADRLNTEAYLAPDSDIVALMVLEHQTQMHNLITRANFVTRSARHYDTIMNKAMDRPPDYQSESGTRRIAAAAEKLVEYLLFADEVQLTEPVQGTSRFASEFSSRGPRDRQGRSLRDLDLQQRMMKYPCSYLIYSEPFDALPDETKSHVYQRLHAILSGKDNSERFDHLATADRRAILEILCETKTDLPDFFRVYD